ncbi:MAG: type II secretion system protein, partial [Planctomycetaceae bacterium]
MAAKMTSETGATKRPNSFVGGDVAEEKIRNPSGFAYWLRRDKQSAIRNGFRRGGFTLFEVMIVLVLLVIVATVGTIVLRPWRMGAGFDEGITRLESVIIQAR